MKPLVEELLDAVKDGAKSGAQDAVGILFAIAVTCLLAYAAGAAERKSAPQATLPAPNRRIAL